jgi:sulfatase maturation enzyme AslB (radical SAM superfamily)
MQNNFIDYDLEKSSRTWSRLPLDGKKGRLPVFFQEQQDKRIYYTPGFVAMAKRDETNSFEASLTSMTTAKYGEISSQLLKHASQTLRNVEESLSRPFLPVCLTIYPSNKCNLHCSYCFSDSQTNKSDTIEISHAKTALKKVAQNCKKLESPITIVFHGGGEPTLNLLLIDDILTLANQLSEEAGLTTFFYIATNGILSIKKAQWVANRFNMIGLSCDGPAFIQDKQRSRLDGSGSSVLIERTASIIKDSGKKFSVRVTLTPDSFLFQEEIADYICRILKPDEIHVEPVYDGGRAGNFSNFNSSHTSIFIEKYLKAQRIAREYGIPWLSSGSRPKEIHGPYCNVFRNVLNLLPGGTATACFKTSTSKETIDKKLVIGRTKSVNGNTQFDIDQNHILELRKNILASPIQNKCKDCFNQYHCVNECPNLCLLDNQVYSFENDFRCSFQKLLGTNVIFESLKKIIATERNNQDVIGGLVTFSG